MIIKTFDPKIHYKEICDWWLGHNWNGTIPQDWLPTTGAIIEGVAAAFLYTTDSTLAIIEFVVSNPKAKKRAIALGIDALAKHLRNRAVQNGARGIFFFGSHNGLLKIFKKNGFEVGDMNMTHVVWRR